jgi:WD40 repeat protein
MLTGDMPFHADTPAKVMMKHILDPVPDISLVLPELPSAISKVVEKSLAKDPDQRYSTAGEMCWDFNAAISMGTQDDIGGQFQSTIGDKTTAINGELTDLNRGTQAIPESGGQPIQTVKDTPIKQNAGVATMADSTAFANQTEGNRSPSAIPSPDFPARSSGIPKFLYWLIPTALVVVLLSVFGLRSVFNSEADDPIIAAAANVLPTSTQSIQPTATDVSPTATSVQPTNTAAPPTPTIGEPTTAVFGVVPTSTQEIAPSDMPNTIALGGADKIAFNLNREIWMANLDGSELTQITSDGQLKTNFQWSPDGKFMYYLAGKCVKSITIDGNFDNLLCIDTAQYFENFSISPHGDQIALSVDNQLFVVPFDPDLISNARNRSDLIAMATCEHLAPYARSAVKRIHWSIDQQQLAMLILAPGSDGKFNDRIQILDISTCVPTPSRLDEFPGERFVMNGYDKAPFLVSTDWDGSALFLMNSFLRNDGFGEIYIYNSDTKKGEKVEPLPGKCCYRDLSWSPDGRWFAFAFQDRSLGSESVTQIYLMRYGDLNTGIDIEPLDLPVLENPREAPVIALRPVSGITGSPADVGDQQPTSTPEVPPGLFVRINEITIEADLYIVEYETFEYTEQLPGMHVHFYYDSVNEEQAGLPGGGPWIVYGGPRPFKGYSVASRPVNAWQMCARVANANHSIILNSGNCYYLPESP